MIRILLTILVLTVSFGISAKGNTVCTVNGITVETNNSEDCKAIGGTPERTYLFVINFDTGSFDGKKLQLNGNGSSNVIFFTDRPERKAGHMGVKSFKSIWTKGIGSFKSDPPNAILSIIRNGKESNIVMS